MSGETGEQKENLHKKNSFIFEERKENRRIMEAA
jgi:hypothetical protein